MEKDSRQIRAQCSHGTVDVQVGLSVSLMAIEQMDRRRVKLRTGKKCLDTLPSTRSDTVWPSTGSRNLAD